MKKNHLLICAVVFVVAALGSYYCTNTLSPFDFHALNVLRFKASKPKVVSKSATRAVAARVNGEVITVDEIKEGYDNNIQVTGQLSFDDFYKKAVDVFVNGKLLYQAAQKANIMKTPEYAQELKTVKEDLARKIFMEKAVEQRVTPAAVQAFYQTEYVSKFTPQKEMNAKHILVDDEALALQAIEKLNNGEDFDTVAKEYTKDKIVDLGYFTGDIMVPEFTAAVEALNVGEYTKAPVKTQFGYHVVLLTDVRDSAPLPLSELEPQIKNILGQQAIAEIFDDLYKKSDIEKFDLEGNRLPDEPSAK